MHLTYMRRGRCLLNEGKERISAKCFLYACRVCRTKTGWPHQSWCSVSGVLSPGCGDCRYWEDEEGACGHPAFRKGGDTA